MLTDKNKEKVKGSIYKQMPKKSKGIRILSDRNQGLDPFLFVSLHIVCFCDLPYSGWSNPSSSRRNSKKSHILEIKDFFKFEDANK
jgi:hypothetical protein